MRSAQHRRRRRAAAAHYVGEAHRRHSRQRVGAARV